MSEMAAPRKSESTVKRGRFRKTENRRYTPGAEVLAGTSVVFERQRPGKGYRHVLRKSDLERFVTLLHEWEELAVGLETIVLLEGRDDLEGIYGPGWIGICAWTRALWHHYDRTFLEAPRKSILRVGVVLEDRGDGLIGKWTDEAVRAYQLVDVFIHELGHHHDRMTTNAQHHAARGEGYAEEFASQFADQIWDAYCAEFAFVPERA
jgi:hypothetical protein